MRAKKGFTLLEVLIVVVIAVSVTAFAVPAYKRTQERNRYLAAQGVLLDLGNSVRMIRAALLDEGTDRTFPYGPRNTLKMSAVYQPPTTSSYYTQSAEGALSDLGSTPLPYALFSRKFMMPIPYDDTTNSRYKEYEFYVCPQSYVKGAGCCTETDAVACMALNNYESHATKGLYYGALFLEDGRVVQVSK